MKQRVFAYPSLTACWRAYKLCGIPISYSQFCRGIYNGGLQQALDDDVEVLASISTRQDGANQAQITIIKW
jgi:hypothetical protein